MADNTPNVSPVQEAGDQIQTRKMTSKLDLIDQKMDNLYKDIYISRPDNRNNLDLIINDLDTALDRLQSSDMSVSNMSELIRRIDKKNDSNTEEFLTSVSSMFEDGNLMGSLIMNESIHNLIAAENYTYDMICKYMPKLQLALEIKRDNVLSSDNFSKEYLNPQSTKSTKAEEEKFDANVKKLINGYDLNKFYERTYMNVSKYGEDFIYIVPYKEAFKRVIKAAQRRRFGQTRFTSFNLYGEAAIEERHVISEGFMDTNEFKSYLSESADLTTLDKALSEEYRGFNLNIYFNPTNIIAEQVNDISVVTDMSQLERFRSLGSVHEASLQKQYEKIKDNNDGLTGASTKLPADGLIVPSELTRDADKVDKNFLGVVVERLPRQNVLPVYIGKICFGYYYFEFAEDPTACGFCGGHHMTPGISNGAEMAQRSTEDQEELIVRYIAAQISQCIDTKFINANKDLKEEIYAILRYNEKFDLSRSNNLGVTFIPADDIVHCYFNQDERTHRGISDLKDAVIPAMLYILLYLSDIIGKVTRSTDKRVYYVKQNIETNVARTMMNVVKQIKKGNMGMRQIESMNNILNIVGKYNDYIIPVGPSGDAPINFEVMQGQDIQTPTDMLDKMEEQAVSSIVPFEFINSILQQDFATRFSMTNTRFLKMIQTAQRDTERFFSKMFTKTYNYEYDECYALIEVKLPPPTYLVSSNNSQLLDNIAQTADKIIEITMSDQEDDVKAEFKKLYVRNILGTYIDFNDVSRMLETAKVNVEAEKNPGTEDGENMDQYM